MMVVVSVPVPATDTMVPSATAMVVMSVWHSIADRFARSVSPTLIKIESKKIRIGICRGFYAFKLAMLLPTTSVFHKWWCCTPSSRHRHDGRSSREKENNKLYECG